ncbi:MAG: insulinase family protein [Verrucomicrobiota bacterium]
MNLKPTDFSKDRIGIKFRLGGGTLTLPKDKPALDMVAVTLMNDGGLEKHSSEDLRQIFAGKDVGFQFEADDDSFEFKGSTTREDLLTQLQLMCAYLTNPGYRPDGLRPLLRQIDALYERMSHVPQGIMQRDVDPFLKSGDYRAGLPPKEAFAQRTVDEVKDWLSEPLKKAYLEVSLVGDLDPEEVIAACAKTVGALPEREASKPDYAEARKMAFPKGPVTKVFPYTSQIPKAMVALYWPTTDQSKIKLTRRLTILAEVLSDRIREKVREELGDAYSPRAGHQASSTYKDYGSLVAQLTVKPEEAEKVAAVVSEIASGIAANGTNKDELERVKKPLLTQIEESRRTNGYWHSSVLDSCQEQPYRLDWAKSMLEDFGGITVEEINALAKQYLDPSKEVQVIVTTE